MNATSSVINGCLREGPIYHRNVPPSDKLTTLCVTSHTHDRQPFSVPTVADKYLTAKRISARP
jgi:predicted small lipoprotein YifL